MPYEGEFAKYKSVQRLVENERVNNLLKRAMVRDDAPDEDEFLKMEIPDICPSSWQPEWVLAVDGSHQEEPVRNGYPGAEIGYVTIAACLMDIAKIKEPRFPKTNQS